MATLVTTIREETPEGAHVTTKIDTLEAEGTEGDLTSSSHEEEEEVTGSSLHARGVALFRGGGVVTQDKAAAVELWETAVREHTHVASSVCLGMALWHGDGVTKDPKRALEMLRKAGRDGGQDGAQAAYFLGMAYLCGDDNLETTTGATEASSEKNSGGQKSRSSNNNSKDPSRAARWFRQAAKSNHAEAHYQLGVMSLGAKDADSVRRACDWLTSAADLGHVKAKEFLEEANKATNVKAQPQKKGSGLAAVAGSGGGGAAEGEPAAGGGSDEDDWLVGLPAPHASAKPGANKKASGGKKNKKKGGR